MSQKNGKLRFAALIRVSTEKQGRQGESLRTQDAQLSGAVTSLGGIIVKRYAGQEHATAGYERKQVQQLLDDAARQPRSFDAVIVADPTRWSRDNVQSETGLEHLRKHGVKFFVLTAESDLFNPRDRFYLSLSTTIGAFHAGEQNHKSIVNRIARAKRNVPASGKVPYGRKWNREREQWEVDETKRAIIVDAANRYLAGESLQKLAREYGMNHSNLHKILTKRCGDTFEIRFRADNLNVNETIRLTIPPLLPEKTIRAILQQVEANRTYRHGKPKNDYLLSGLIFCGQCSYNLFGQMNHGGRRYYRHAHRERAEACSLDPRPWVRADLVETEVISQLVELFGNPAAIKRACERAIPNQATLLEAKQRVDCCTSECDKVAKARTVILNLIERDAITFEHAEAKLDDLKAKGADAQVALDKARDILDQLQAEAGIRNLHLDFGNIPGTTRWDADKMSREDRLALLEETFGQPLTDGRPAGAYIYPTGDNKVYRPKAWKFVLRGRVRGVLDETQWEGPPGNDDERSTGDVDFQLVMHSASRSPGTAPPARRSVSPPPRPPA
jgi:DNA invertase Pin-like site-specific DNA recombinase